MQPQFAAPASKAVRFSSRAELLSSAVDGSAVGVSIYEDIRPHSAIVYANASFCRLIGVDFPSLDGESLWDLILADDRRRIDDLRVQAAAEESVLDTEFRLCRPDGRQLWVRMYAYPLPGDAENSASWAVSLRDFTVQHEQHAQIKMLSQAIEQSGELYLIADVTPPSQGGPFIEYLNPALLEFIGYSSEEIVGKPYTIFFGPRTDERVKEHIAEGAEQMFAVAHELLIRRKNGEHVWVEFVGGPIFDEAGEHRHWLLVGRDVTARRRAQAQTVQLLSAIEHIDVPIAIYAVRERGEIETAYENAAATRSSAEIRQALASHGKHGLEELASGTTVRLVTLGTAIELRALFDDDGCMEAILATGQRTGLRD